MKDEFSIRNNLKENNKQKNSIDQDLRNSLWNVIHLLLLQSKEGRNDFNTYEYFGLYRAIWISYFRYKINDMPYTRFSFIEKFDTDFQIITWNEVFGLIEFIGKYLSNNKKSVCAQFSEFVNVVFERENSIYRLIDNFIVPIEEVHERNEIENALKNLESINAVKIHIISALKLLSDKERPDYRNSIKESITAVEGLCALIIGNKKATLGKALEQIEDKIKIHPALKIAFDKIYGYTSDADGIRHPATEDSQELHSEDARYWLISCSAFINYLIQKCERHGIRLQ